MKKLLTAVFVAVLLATTTSACREVFPCADHWTECGDACVDFTVDNANCGACGKSCLGGAVCIAGVCSCLNGQSNCGGTCVNLLTDPGNCGVCNMQCQGNSPMCSLAHCQVKCDVKETPCNNACVNLQSDPSNCGACGAGCPAPPHANPACAMGMCGMGSCFAAFANCDGNAANGCEINIASDALNCGKCGAACPNGQSCMDGVCQVPVPKADLNMGSDDGGDAGGVDLGVKPLGAPCAVGPDCQSGNCYKQFCAVPTCGDGKQNGNESDRDCGGPLNECSPRCAVGKFCFAGSDCQSGKCNGLCQ